MIMIMMIIMIDNMKVEALGLTLSEPFGGAWYVYTYIYIYIYVCIVRSLRLPPWHPRLWAAARGQHVHNALPRRAHQCRTQAKRARERIWRKHTVPMSCGSVAAARAGRAQGSALQVAPPLDSATPSRRLTRAPPTCPPTTPPHCSPCHHPELPFPQLSGVLLRVTPKAGKQRPCDESIKTASAVQHTVPRAISCALGQLCRDRVTIGKVTSERASQR